VYVTNPCAVDILMSFLCRPSCYIYDLLNDVVSISDYIALDGRMISVDEENVCYWKYAEYRPNMHV
jgi:hypothetical protein